MPTDTQIVTPLTSRLADRLIVKLGLADPQFEWHAIDNGGLVSYGDDPNDPNDHLIKILQEKHKFLHGEAYEVIEECDRAKIPVPPAFSWSKLGDHRMPLQIVDYLATWLLHEVMKPKLSPRG